MDTNSQAGEQQQQISLFELAKLSRVIRFSAKKGPH